MEMFDQILVGSYRGVAGVARVYAFRLRGNEVESHQVFPTKVASDIVGR